MASFIAGLLTVILVINCLVLIFLVLIQMPKKDAGAGLAFGGGAADALFGAGSGNVLTKVTKWAVVVFFLLALFLGYYKDKLYSAASPDDFKKQIEQKQMELPPISGSQPSALPAAAPAPVPASAPAPTLPTNTPEAPAQAK
jgi:preprotein translocase subunit SecG